MNRILLKNAHLWDCGETVDLLIEEDSIQKIASNITDRDAKVVNLNYKTLYPGFFNAHVHLYGLRGPLPDSMLKRFLAGGVTTVRDMGMTYDAPYTQYQDWLSNHRDYVYPTIISASKFICTEKSYGAVHPTGEKIGHIIPPTAEASVQAVDEMADCGANLIKTGNDYGMDINHPLDYLPSEVFNAVIQRAKERGLPSAAHITKAKQFTEAAEMGLTEGAHVPNDLMTDEQVARAVAAGMSFTATMSVFDYAEIQFGEHLMDSVISNTRRLYRAGMPMAVGTDFMREIPDYQVAGIPVHEFHLLHKAGLSVEEIIRAATIESAKICGIDKKTGSIEPGKWADLVAVSSPADETFCVFEDVPFVMHQGHVIVNR